MELVPYLPLLNLLLMPVIGVLWRLSRLLQEMPVVKQRVARLEKRCFGLEGLPADQS